MAASAAATRTHPSAWCHFRTVAIPPETTASATEPSTVNRVPRARSRRFAPIGRHHTLRARRRVSPKWAISSASARHSPGESRDAGLAIIADLPRQLPLRSARSSSPRRPPAHYYYRPVHRHPADQGQNNYGTCCSTTPRRTGCSDTPCDAVRASKLLHTVTDMADEPAPGSGHLPPLYPDGSAWRPFSASQSVPLSRTLWSSLRARRFAASGLNAGVTADRDIHHVGNRERVDVHTEQ